MADNRALQSDAAELRELRSVLRAFLEKNSPESAVRHTMESNNGFDAALWRAMAQDLGLQGLAVAEEYGGAGAGWAAQAIVFEELGRALACVPYLATVGFAVPLLLASGDDAAARWLPDIVSGTCIATVAVAEGPRRGGPCDIHSIAEPDGAGWRITGRKPYVLDGCAADLLLVLARSGAGLGVFAVAGRGPGVNRTPMPTSDRTRRVARVEFDSAPATLVGPAGAGWQLTARAELTAMAALSCEQVGGAAKSLELAVSYAQTREQFGRPIGSFQAVKHKCADMLVAVEGARSAAGEAIRAFGQDDATAAAVIAIASAVCGDAYARCASDCVQVHGGIGYTWEHPAHLHVKRSRGSLVLFGTPGEQRRSEPVRALIASAAHPSEENPIAGQATVEPDVEKGVNLAQAAPEANVSVFRSEVLQWLAQVQRPLGLNDYGPTPSSQDVPAGRAWQQRLAEAGYACLHWPKEFGGRDASVAEQAAFAEICAVAGVPRQLNIVGPDLVGPVLMAFGSPEQQQRYLNPIRLGQDMWCQLFSEPDAGSDLASVRTRARRTNTGWIVDGQKVWTSGGEDAEYGLLLARSGGPGHAGLSVFVVRMSAPGVLVRPLRQMDDECKFNEVFLDSVELPADALVGAEGGGWKVASATLGRERLSLGSNAVGMFSALAAIGHAAAEHGLLEQALTDDLVRLWIQVWLLRATWHRAVAEGAAPGDAPFSVLKLLASETHRDIANLGIQALGLDALASENDEPLVRNMLIGHAQTILGGTSEIQRSIIGERVLGLPREPKFARR